MPLAIFDLDGTLVDSAPGIGACLNRLMEARGLAPFPLADVVSMIGDGAGALLLKAFGARGATLDEAALEAFLADLEANGAALTQPYPGIPAALDALAAAGWRLAICTNKPLAATHALLASLSLAARFDVVLGGDSLSARKPDPAHVLAVLAAARVAPGDAAMIGDHQNDIRAGKGAGVCTIFAAWGYGTGEGAALRAGAPGDLAGLLAGTRLAPHTVR